MTPDPTGTTTAPPSPRTQAMRRGRHTDSARRRQRVLAALNKATTDGTEGRPARRARPRRPTPQLAQ